MWKRRTIAFAALTMGAVACDGTPVTAPAMLAPPPLEARGVRAYVVEEMGGTADRVTLTIRIQSKDVGVAAYQGRLEFDPSVVEILEATVPSGDGTRLVNAAAGPGTLRFAGFATEKFTGATAVTLVVHPLKPLAQANFLTSLDVAGEANGTALQQPLMLPQKGFYTAAAPE